MGAMKDIDIMVTSLRLDKFYNVEYMDGDVVVKKQHVRYIGKHKDLLDGIGKLVFQHYLSLPNDFDIMINPYMLINVEESDLKKYHGDIESSKDDNRIQLVKEQWNRDELIIGKAYRLVKDKDVLDSLLISITKDYLEFLVIQPGEYNASSILVNPNNPLTDYSVYKMGVIK